MAAKFGCNELGKTRIRLVKPSPRRDTVRDISELVRSIDLDKVFEDGGLDKVRMEFSYTVDLVATNDSQISHSHHLRLRFFDNRHSSKHLTLLGIFPLHHVEELHVNLVDDLKMSGK